MTPPMHDRRRAVRTAGLVALTAGLGVTIWFLDRSGGGALASPPIGSIEALRSWAAQRDAAEIVMAVTRLVALALAWYLMALTIAGAFLRLFRSRRLVVATDRITPASVRSLLDHAVGIGLTGAAVLGAIVPSVVDDRTPPLELAGAEQADVESSASQTRLDGVARQQRLTADVHPLTVRDPEPAAPAPRPTSAARPDEPAPSVWVITAGDHLWRVAEEALTEAYGHRVGERRVARYWNQLIELNRDVLVDRENPDLVYPGQVFALPPLPAGDPQGR